jgi:hypothetical protein
MEQIFPENSGRSSSGIKFIGEYRDVSEYHHTRQAPPAPTASLAPTTFKGLRLNSNLNLTILS